jgi:excisionase family DNA binding protein
MTQHITVNAAAVLLRVHPTHVRRLARAGKLEATRTTPRKTLITLASVEALIDENNNN